MYIVLADKTIKEYVYVIRDSEKNDEERKKQ